MISENEISGIPPVAGASPGIGEAAAGADVGTEAWAVVVAAAY
jgi:hypothetical protein